MTEPDPRDATIERLQRDRLEWRNRAILAESEIRRAARADEGDPS